MKNSSIQQRNSVHQINTNSSIPFLPFKESLSINFTNQNEKEELDNIIRLIKLETDNNVTNFDILLNLQALYYQLPFYNLPRHLYFCLF